MPAQIIPFQKPRKAQKTTKRQALPKHKAVLFDIQDHLEPDEDSAIMDLALDGAICGMSIEEFLITADDQEYDEYLRIQALCSY